MIHYLRMMYALLLLRIVEIRFSWSFASGWIITSACYRWKIYRLWRWSRAHCIQPHTTFPSSHVIFAKTIDLYRWQNHPPSLPENVDILIALYDFQGVEDDDLSFKIGDVVRLLHPHSVGRWKVRRISDDAIGVVPSSYFVSNWC